MPGSFFLTVSLFFLVLFVFTLFFYAGTPFILITLNTVLSFFFAGLLIFFNLGFAAAVLIIVNAGAISMVFLFVCILTRRESITDKANLTGWHVLSVMLSCYFFVHFYLEVLVLATYNNASFFFNIWRNWYYISLIRVDWSAASHLLLFSYDPQWSGLLPLLGIFLFISMTTAIYIARINSK